MKGYGVKLEPCEVVIKNWNTLWRKEFDKQLGKTKKELTVRNSAGFSNDMRTVDNLEKGVYQTGFKQSSHKE